MCSAHQLLLVQPTRIGTPIISATFGIRPLDRRQSRSLSTRADALPCRLTPQFSGGTLTYVSWHFMLEQVRCNCLLGACITFGFLCCLHFTLDETKTSASTTEQERAQLREESKDAVALRDP